MDFELLKRKLNINNIHNILVINNNDLNIIEKYINKFLNANIYILNTIYINNNLNNNRVFLCNHIDNNLKFDLIINNNSNNNSIENLINFNNTYINFLSDNGILIIEYIPELYWLNYIITYIPDKYKQFIKTYNKYSKNNIIFTLNKNIRNDSNNINLDIGFIILRYVRDEITNKYWIECYNRIRTYYPENEIVIIDDNSNYNYITTIDLYKTKIIKSDFPPGRGELLPYYYYANNKYFDTAVILHDSCFINAFIDFEVEDFKSIFYVPDNNAKGDDIYELLLIIGDKELIDYYNKYNIVTVCFGALCSIKHSLLQEINKKYDFSKLINIINARYYRCIFERIIGIILSKYGKFDSFLGNQNIYNIHYFKNLSFERSLIELNDKPLIKHFTGR